MMSAFFHCQHTSNRLLIKLILDKFLLKYKRGGGQIDPPPPPPPEKSTLKKPSLLRFKNDVCPKFYGLRSYATNICNSV